MSATASPSGSVVFSEKPGLLSRSSVLVMVAVSVDVPPASTSPSPKAMPTCGVASSTVTSSRAAPAGVVPAVRIRTPTLDWVHSTARSAVSRAAWAEVARAAPSLLIATLLPRQASTGLPTSTTFPLRSFSPICSRRGPGVQLVCARSSRVTRKRPFPGTFVVTGDSSTVVPERSGAVGLLTRERARLDFAVLAPDPAAAATARLSCWAWFQLGRLPQARTAALLEVLCVLAATQPRHRARAAGSAR